MLFGRKWGCGCGCNHNCGCMPQPPVCEPNPCECDREIVEPTITKCVEKEFFHEVPQV